MVVMRKKKIKARGAEVQMKCFYIRAFLSCGAVSSHLEFVTWHLGKKVADERNLMW